MPWNDGSAFQFSAPQKMPRNPRKRTTGKIRTRRLGRNRFNPIKMRRPNTPKTKVSDLDRIDADIKAKVTDLLILPLMTKAPEDTVGMINSNELSKVERKQQQEEEKYKLYQRVYAGQLSEGEESDTESDCSVYSYCA